MLKSEMNLEDAHKKLSVVILVFVIMLLSPFYFRGAAQEGPKLIDISISIGETQTSSGKPNDTFTFAR